MCVLCGLEGPGAYTCPRHFSLRPTLCATTSNTHQYNFRSSAISFRDEGPFGRWFWRFNGKLCASFSSKVIVIADRRLDEFSALIPCSVRCGNKNMQLRRLVIGTREAREAAIMRLNRRDQRVQPAVCARRYPLQRARTAKVGTTSTDDSASCRHVPLTPLSLKAC